VTTQLPRAAELDIKQRYLAAGPTEE